MYPSMLLHLAQCTLLLFADKAKQTGQMLPVHTTLSTATYAIFCPPHLLCLLVCLQIPQVPEEWYTSCGLEPPDSSLPIYPSMLLDSEAAAAVADSLAGVTGHALGSPRQHSKSSSLHQHAGSFRSCSSCSAQQNIAASGSSEAAAAAAVEEVLEELTAAVDGSSEQQQQVQQQQEAEQQLQAGNAVPRPVGAMLYPGTSTPLLVNSPYVIMR
jgi:hypothetical protein